MADFTTPFAGLHLMGVNDTLWASTCNANMLHVSQAAGNIQYGAAQAGVQVGTPSELRADGKIYAGWSGRHNLRGVCYAVVDGIAYIRTYGSAIVRMAADSTPEAGMLAIVSGYTCIAVHKHERTSPQTALGVIDRVLASGACEVSLGCETFCGAGPDISAAWLHNANTQSPIRVTRTAMGRVTLGPDPAVFTSTSTIGLTGAQTSGNNLRVDWPGAFSEQPMLHMGFENSNVVRYAVDVLNGDYGIFRLYGGNNSIISAASATGIAHIIAIGGKNAV